MTTNEREANELTDESAKASDAPMETSDAVKIPSIWTWDGEYAEGMDENGEWFCFEADADPEHPELGGVTVEMAENVLRELGFTDDEISAARSS